jgi:hypothetical protein
VDLLSLLDENGFTSGGLEVVGEDSSAFGDDGGGFVVLENSDIEFFSFLGSDGIEFGNISLEGSDFPGLLVDKAGEDFSSGVEFSLESGFESDSL